MFSKFFINRPIFASVLSIVIVLAGLVAGLTLPIAQYPEIAPPTVEVSAYYPGANAQIVADTVAAPIEQQVNGVENMMYMSSQCTNDGNYTLTITFKPGTDLNIAQVLVQQRQTLALPVLPQLVQRRGISVKKKTPNVLMIVNLFATEDSEETSAEARAKLSLYLSNYATIQIRDELSRIPGVGDVTYLGQRDYSMRVWLDTQKLASLGLNPNDVNLALAAQNIQVAAGQIGQPPVPSGQVFQYIMTTKGRLQTPEEFKSIVLKNNQSSLVYLRDVAQVELGAQSYDQTSTLNGRPSVALSIYQSPGSNALDVANRVKERMKELREHFSPGVDYAIVYDTTPFIQESIRQVFDTLFDAIVLVAVVVLVFLQNWRSSLIPLIAVPVAVIGTFAVMAAMGFSLNNLTLFGLVLAIGIVVDDAIVVVEAVEHHIEHGLTPREATIRAMEQVSGPVVAIGLVLAAVFLPSAFITGIIGQFYRQFALTIAVSTLISAFNSLTLSPALSAILLRPRVRGKFEILPWFVFVPLLAWVGHKLGERFLLQGEHLLAHLHVAEEWWSAIILYTPILVGGLAGVLVGTVLSRPVNALAFAFFRIFNRIFDLSTAGYTRLVAGFLRVSFIVIIVYGGLLFLTWFQFKHTPTGFIPAQDKGYLVLNIQLPDAAAVGRTENRMEQIQRIALGDKAMNGRYRGETPAGAKLYDGIRGVKDTVSIAGQSILLNANAPNFGSMYVMLDRFEERTDSELSADAIAKRLQEAISEEIPEAIVNVFGAPPVEGLGTSGGFKIIIQDRENSGLPALQEVADNTIDEGRKDPRLRGLFTSFRANTPWLELDIDREQAKNRGVSIDDIRTTLESSLGPYYVNDFNLFGRTWEVNVQSEDTFRRTPEQAIQRLYVMNAQRNPVPLSDFVTIKPIDGPVLILRYNLYPSAAVNAEAGPDTSSGQAIDSLQAAAQSQLPRQMRAEWTELAFLQLQTGNTAMLAFAAAVAFVFLVLAAQYESWSLPLAVILVVPMCLLCSVTGVAMARMDINIFTQIGFLVLVGLACKNAILIVEYAKVQREAGMSRFEATLAACRLRLRPILMTSFAFILGVVPLVIAEGAGAEMRRTLGLAVFGGMLGVTIFGIFLTPVFFYVIQYFKKGPGPEPALAGPLPPLPVEPLPASDHDKPTGIRTGDSWPT